MGGIGEKGRPRDGIGQRRLHLPNLRTIEVLDADASGFLAFEMGQGSTEIVVALESKEPAAAVDHFFHAEPSG